MPQTYTVNNSVVVSTVGDLINVLDEIIDEELVGTEDEITITIKADQVTQQQINQIFQ